MRPFAGLRGADPVGIVQPADGGPYSLLSVPNRRFQALNASTYLAVLLHCPGPATQAACGAGRGSKGFGGGGGHAPSEHAAEYLPSAPNSDA